MSRKCTLFDLITNLENEVKELQIRAKETPNDLIIYACTGCFDRHFFKYIVTCALMSWTCISHIVEYLETGKIVSEEFDCHLKRSLQHNH